MVRTHVKMLTTDRGAENGIDIKTYQKDKTYPLGLSLAKAFVEDRKTAEYVNEPTEDGKEPEEKKDKVIDWLAIDHKSVTRDQLMAATKDLGMEEPGGDATKAEILALIQTKLKDEGAEGGEDEEEKKSLLDKAKDLITGGGADEGNEDNGGKE